MHMYSDQNTYTRMFTASFILIPNGHITPHNSTDKLWYTQTIEYHTTERMDNFLLYSITGMNSINCQAKEASHERVRTIWLNSQNKQNWWTNAIGSRENG